MEFPIYAFDTGAFRDVKSEAAASNRPQLLLDYVRAGGVKQIAEHSQTMQTDDKTPFPSADEDALTRTFKREIDFFRTIPMFAVLSDLELARLSQIVSVRRYYKGNALLTEGQLNDALYMVRDGFVSLESQETNGKPFLQLGKGRFFGQVSLFDPSPSSATVTAVTDVEVICVRGQALNSLLIVHPAVGTRLLMAIIQDLAHRYRTLLHKTKNVAPNVVGSECVL